MASSGTVYSVTTSAMVVDGGDGELSLLEALIAAETNAASGDAMAGSSTGVDTIYFDSNVTSIFMGDALVAGLIPTLTDSLVIDGTIGGGRVDLINDAATTPLFTMAPGTGESFSFDSIIMRYGAADAGSNGGGVLNFSG